VLGRRSVGRQTSELTQLDHRGKKELRPLFQSPAPPKPTPIQPRAQALINLAPSAYQPHCKYGLPPSSIEPAASQTTPCHPLAAIRTAAHSTQLPRGNFPPISAHKNATQKP
jgi:hypothetical protein